MKHLRWQVLAGLSLLVLSVLLYEVHYLLFADAHHIWLYLVGDIAFLPVEVLLVTLIVHELLRRREKRALFAKLNMVIGAFFSEVGTELLARLAKMDERPDDLRRDLAGMAQWPARRFAELAHRFADRPCRLPDADDLVGLRNLLAAKRPFLLVLLENPNLLEHERFTDVLWATFHLTEELILRPELAQLPDSDLKHLAGDIRRAYGRLMTRWLHYMRHLQADYPYLFSLAARTNPFDPAASPVVAEK